MSGEPKTSDNEAKVRQQDPTSASSSSLALLFPNIVLPVSLPLPVQFPLPLPWARVVLGEAGMCSRLAELAQLVETRLTCVECFRCSLTQAPLAPEPAVVVEEPEVVPQKTVSEIFAEAGQRALGGGLPGAAAMGVQVLSLMWLRTTINYQYRHGTGTLTAFRFLYKEGGVRRFYRGVGPALFQVSTR